MSSCSVRWNGLENMNSLLSFKLTGFQMPLFTLWAFSMRWLFPSLKMTELIMLLTNRLIKRKPPLAHSTKAPLVSQLAAITLSAVCLWLRDRVVLLFKPQWEKWVNLAVWDPLGSTGLPSQGQDSPSWVREPYLLGECSFILTPCCYWNPAGV